MKNITPNRSGTGSTYGGTQSNDKDAPDGYQQPKQTDNSSAEGTDIAGNLGDEYDSDSSYGQQDNTVKKSGSQEEGSPIP